MGQAPGNHTAHGWLDPSIYVRRTPSAAVAFTLKRFSLAKANDTMMSDVVFPLVDRTTP